MSAATLTRTLTHSGRRALSTAPASLSRVGEALVFPRERPGLDYKFNWSLNGDGVTPTKRSAFRLMAGKELDLKVAQLPVGKGKKTKAAAASKMPEAGTPALSFDAFDMALQTAKDTLSASENLYCPEGHAPGAAVGVRIITNCPDIAVKACTGFLERMPKRDPASQQITLYVVSSAATDEFAGYAIEEEDGQSVSSVVVMGKKPAMNLVVAGVELSLTGFEADAAAAAAEGE